LRGAVLGAQVRCPKYVAPSTLPQVQQPTNINKYYQISTNTIIYCHLLSSYIAILAILAILATVTWLLSLAAFVVGKFVVGKFVVGKFVVGKFVVGFRWLLLGYYLVSVTWSLLPGKFVGANYSDQHLSGFLPFPSLFHLLKSLFSIYKNFFNKRTNKL